MSIKAIIFDCDGVLVETEPIAIKVLVECLEDIGIHIDFNKALYDCRGGNLNDHLLKYSSQYKVDVPENFVADFRERMYIRFEDGVNAVPGVKEIMKDLRLPFSVASNGPMKKMEVTLEMSGLYNYFKGQIYSAYDIGAWKPDPKIYLIVAEKMGLEPSDCLVIEDSAPGIQAGLDAGMQVWAYAEEGREEELSATGAHKIFNSMGDVLKLLKEN
jgi:HAD superfamily hydrolase (TIGR01509 family)